jgi:hypothetical protein
VGPFEAAVKLIIYVRLEYIFGAQRGAIYNRRDIKKDCYNVYRSIRFGKHANYENNIFADSVHGESVESGNFRGILESAYYTYPLAHGYDH